MDVALILASGEASFHYSPLKLREYMSCGRAVIGPAVGELQRHVEHGKNGVLVDPGDPEAFISRVTVP